MTRIFQNLRKASSLIDPAIKTMDLKTVVSKLNKFAPTSLAEKWDNVGLLIEPSPPHQVKKMLLTNDLTENVMEEALEKKANMILSYHPPIFAPLKRLTQSSWKERIVIKCIENRIALFAPHTSYDALFGGVNDWLISPFAGKITPLHPVDSKQFPTPGGLRLEMTVPSTQTGDIMKSVKAVNGITVTFRSEYLPTPECPKEHIVLNCTEKGLPEVMKILENYEDTKSSVQISQLNKPPIPDHGMGRLCKLKDATTLKNALEAIKGHLKMKHVRLATAVGETEDQKIKSVAVCAGSGFSVLKGTPADLYVTGEMSHHEVLEFTHKGISVILCDHSNAERGYLTGLRVKLLESFENKMDIEVSEVDADPLKIV